MDMSTFMNLQSIIFGIFGFLGTIYTVYGFYKNSTYKLGYIEKKSFPLVVDKNIEKDLKIFYKEKKIFSIQKTTYRIFNAGKKSLRKEDLYDNNLKIFSKDGKILDIEMNIKENIANFKIEKENENEYLILFDYFDSDQIIDVNLLSDGKDITISCCAPDMPKITKYKDSSNSLRDTVASFFLFLFFIIVTYALITSEKQNINSYIIISILCIYLILSPFIIYANFLDYLHTPAKKILKYQFQNDSQVKP